MSENEAIDPNFLLVQQIEATNRSGAATRGLLKVVLYEGTGLLLGGAIAAWGFAAGSNGALGFAGMLVVAGTIAAMWVGFEALRDSEVPLMRIPGIRKPKGFQSS